MLGPAKRVQMTGELQPWLDEALHAMIVDRQRSLRELLSAYDVLEEQALGFLTGDSNRERALDLRRELASLRLTAAKQRGSSAPDALALFERREQLGYSLVDQRVIVTAIFARICLTDGHPELEHGELDDALLSVPVGKYPSIEELARTLHAAKQDR